ncbi:MAG: CBS domain-containing protein [Alphaproteobacteria bacterium]
MPCHAAVSKNVIIISEDDTVDSVLRAMSKSKASVAIALNSGGGVDGVLSKKILLKSLIPVSVAMAGGVQIDVKVAAAPGVSKRYGNILPLPVSEVMERKPHTLLPDSPIWEGVAHLTKYSSPVLIVDDKGKYFGAMTYDSLLSHLAEALPADG